MHSPVTSLKYSPGSYTEELLDCKRSRAVLARRAGQRVKNEGSEWILAQTYVVPLKKNYSGRVGIIQFQFNQL